MTETKRILVAGGGMPLPRSTLSEIAARCNAVIAADSGLHHLIKSSIPVSQIIGDFDSIAPELRDSVPESTLRHEPGQQDTDLEKAICLAMAHGATHIDLVGVTGDRLDHSVNAISLMVRYARRVEMTLHDAGGRATLATQSPITLEGTPGEKVSLIPAPTASGLRSRGLRYPLDGMDLRIGGRDAISNEIVKNPVTLDWDDGAFLVYRHRQTDRQQRVCQ